MDIVRIAEFADGSRSRDVPVREFNSSVSPTNLDWESPNYFEEIKVPPNYDYLEYRRRGILALEAAQHRREEDGLDAAVPLYKIASSMFLQSMVKTSSLDFEIGEVDAVTLMNYGTCLEAQASATVVEPYKSELSKNIDRRTRLQEMARKAFILSAELLEPREEFIKNT